MKIKGHGSVVPLEEKSRYKCRKWRLYVSTECGQKTRVFSGSWSEACKALEAFKQELSDKVPDSETFAAYAGSWMAYRANLGVLAPGTIENYRRNIAALNRSKLSTMRLSDIEPQDCRDALMWIKQNPQRRDGELTNTTMNKIYILLKQIFTQAVDDGIIFKSPMDRVTTPKVDTKEKAALTPSELFQFVRDLDSLPLDGRTMSLYFMALLGLRRAEVCALLQADVDNESVFVHQAIKERDGSIGEPKSPASVRLLPMPQELARRVESYREHSNGELLIVNTRGGVLRPQLLQRWWAGDSKHNGVRDVIGYTDITLHQLRHSNLSMMARYMSPYDLQRYAGWSSIEPAKVYVHADSSRIEQAINAAFNAKEM